MGEDPGDSGKVVSRDRAVRRCARQHRGLGLITMRKDFGVDVEVTVHIGANAAKGIVERKGIQK